MKQNKKGFTLIELLAVIIILGILMIIAIPSVTSYINNSRKSAYIDTAKEIIAGARNFVNEGKIEMFSTDTTYYIDNNCIKMENASKSPYGEFVKAYVVVTYDGNGYDYYFTSIDEARIGIKNIVKVDNLDEDDIETDLNIDDILTNVGIGFRNKTALINSNCEIEPSVDALSNVSENSNENMLINIFTKEEVKESSILNYGTSENSGVFVLSSTKNNTNPIYFYRGNVNNNNLIFAGFCWKIVRTDEYGGIKIIYNGLPNSGTCNNTSDNSVITKTKYSEFNRDNTYMGYKYGISGASNYDDAHSNMNDSNIKTVIDSWYEDNLSQYSNFLLDSVFCNDRSVAIDSPGEGYGTNATNYNGRYRLNINKTPSLECTNNNDKYTVSSSRGNGKLRYPIALLTADEASLAGSVWNQSSSCYLNIGIPWWTMTPSRLNNVYPSVFVILDNGGLYAHSGNLDGVRPVVTLKSIVSFKEGTDGSVTNPYVVE